MMMSQECLDLVGEAFKLNRDDPKFEDKGGDLVWRLARVKVRGGDPHNKGKEDIGAIFKSHYNGDTEPFETLCAKCLEDAWKEWNEEKAGDAADISTALNALEDERAAEQQAEEEPNLFSKPQSLSPVSAKSSKCGLRKSRSPVRKLEGYSKRLDQGC